MSEKPELDLESLKTPTNEQEAVNKGKVLGELVKERFAERKQEITDENIAEGLHALDSLIDMAKSDNKGMRPALGKLMAHLFAYGAPALELIEPLKKGLITKKLLKECLEMMRENYKTVKNDIQNSTADAEIRRLIKKVEELDK